MDIEKTSIEGLLILTPKVFSDDRGLFFETYNHDTFSDIVPHISFKQDNHSVSHKNVVRGLHLQKYPYGQGKLVRVLNGLALDVAVDLREGSPTFGKHESILLSGGNRKMFWIPQGFAHGFKSLADNTHFHYKCTNTYHKETECCLLYNDKDLNIDWGDINNIKVSEKDLNGMSFSEFKKENL
jgi:dTDP-4-dehydrorhamnose 3,5-epimerase